MFASFSRPGVLERSFSVARATIPYMDCEASLFEFLFSCFFLLFGVGGISGREHVMGFYFPCWLSVGEYEREETSQEKKSPLP